MKELFKALKQNILQGLLFYLLPFILLFIKIKYYDMHRLDRLMAITGLRHYSRISEFIASILFILFVFLLGLAYQKFLLSKENTLKTLKYSLKKGPGLMWSTLLYYVLFSFVVTAINMLLIPLMFISRSYYFNLLAQIVIIVLIVFSVIVHLIAKIENHQRYKNPLNVLFEIKSLTVLDLMIMVGIYGMARLVISLIFEYVIPFRYTAIMQNNIVIFSHGLTFLLLIAIQNYSVIYYNKLTQIKTLQEVGRTSEERTEWK